MKDIEDALEWLDSHFTFTKEQVGAALGHGAGRWGKARRGS